MNKTARHLRFVYTILQAGLLVGFFAGILGLFAACAPKPKPEAVVPVAEISYEDQTAAPTVSIPKPDTNGGAKYQLGPKKIINTAHAKAPVEIILGEAEVRNSKISYNSVSGKMQITGSAVILNDLKEKTTEKYFSLEGETKDNESAFILREANAGPKEAISVSAQANCLTATPQNTKDCDHVMIDVYIFHNNKYYTEQVELDRRQPEIKKTPAPVPQAVPAPAPAPATTAPQDSQTSTAEVQNENDDHIETQQTEESDESLSGRYQGSAETIDLTKLFPQEEHVRIEKEERKTETQPAPVTPVAPPLVKEKILSPDLKQTREGEVRPINQALGFPDKGSLRNATSVLTRQQALSKKAFFEVVAPDRKKYFATYDLAELLSRSGDQLNKQYSKLLYIANLSAQNGGELTAIINGKLTKHASHQNGLDADLAYPSDINHLKFPLVVRMKTLEYFPKNYSVEKTYSLIKFLFTQKDILVDRFFIDQKIKQELCTYAIAKNEFTSENKAQTTALFESIQHVAGHGDHFHVRIKCSKSDPACRSRIYKKMESCKLN